MTASKVCSVCGTRYDEDQKFCPNDGSSLVTSEPTDDLVGQVIADRYRLISTLGEGGMGRVYLAEHVRMRRQCAVKVISPTLARTDAAVARFNREAANASQINHPNVVQVYDFGEGPNHALYLAMEYVNGQTLSAIVRREGPLSVRRAAMLAEQVADALAAAHHHGIIHRDLKPDNILVARHHDGSELVKVVDFGIAKTVQGDGAGEGARGGQTVTTAGVSIGTPEYMSPEQLSGERLDTRTDIYSLGLVFFHLLTADLPYPPGTSRENLIRRLTSAPRTLREVRPNQSWPDTLQSVLDKALATEVEQRYATAGDFGRDLAALVAAAPPDPDVTVRLKAAGTAPPIAPTVKESAPAPVATAPLVPVATPRPKGRAIPLITALFVGALVIAVAVKGIPWRKEPLTVPDTNAIASSTAPAPVVTPPTTPVDTTKIDSAATTPPLARTKTNPVVANPKPAARETTTQVAASAPANQPAPTDAALRLNSLTPRHPALRAIGDSTRSAPLPADAPISARVAAIQRDVDGHISLGRQALLSGDVGRARAEFRQSVQETVNVVSVFPANPDVIRLRDSTTRSLRGVILQCQAAIQRGVFKPADPTFKCPSLVPARFLGQRGRGG